METNKWLFFGVPVALIALVLGATEFQRYRLAQPAKGQVEAGFSEAIAVFYPGTRLSNAGKLDSAPLYCKTFDCREPATVIDKDGRTATIAVSGNRNSRPAAISTNGQYVAFADLDQVYKLSDGEFSTLMVDEPEDTDGSVVINEQGHVQVIQPFSTVYDGDRALPGSRVTTFEPERQTAATVTSVGTLFSCDGHHMILGQVDPPIPQLPVESHLTSDGSMVEVREEPILNEETIVDGVCHNDGSGKLTFVLEGPTIPDQDLISIRLYEKPWGEPFTPLTEKAMVHFDLTNHEHPYGMVRDEEAVWLLATTGEVRRIDLKTGEATTPWQMEDPFNEEARTHGMIFDDYVLYIGAKPGSAKEYIARAYNRKTGEVKLTKTLPLLTNTYGGKDIMHITVRDPDALYAWLETQPDLKE